MQPSTRQSGWAGSLALLLVLAAFPPLAAAEPAGEESLEVRFARLLVELAENNLARAQWANQRVANSVPAEALTDLRAALETAQARLQTVQGNGGSVLPIWLRGAEAEARADNARYLRAVAANQATPDTIDRFEVGRLRLRAELSRLQVERGKVAAGQSPAAQLAWQLDFLYDQLQQLQEQLRRTGPPGTAPYRVWW